MLKNIPTHLIAGPLGAGKTSLIRQLLEQRPAQERWAVLINEFGQIGLDAALLSTDQDGVEIGEVAGGCLCCVNGVPFQVGLARLLRKAKPHRVFIEPSGLGHPQQLLEQLRLAPWQDVLAVQAPILVLDAQALAQDAALPESQQAALSSAGLILLNKSESLTQADKVRVQLRLPDRPLIWTEHAQLQLQQLPGLTAQPSTAASAAELPVGVAPPVEIWRKYDQPICQIHDQPEGWSLGWRWHPSQQFELSRLQRWLLALPWQRAKLIVCSDAGWLSANALTNQPLHWQQTEWRKDSRIELIFKQAQDVDALSQSLHLCLLSGKK
ncbi:GTP-binding protein [Pseudomonas sp. M30-35]|uniref:CobW family GTP-binding protein n=1 Tax=Pseudomonas sp. M30-35 TaxID=1981174 RepID=UPI000B3BFA48|nr:CobW-like GTP-binding protein [Pseudomonas sp. M30-35]ARU90507.1 cobalamin biosynthesis protein CobW [Pseudomonas sp. M30-35]